jgi:hypothetical protein
MAKKPKPPTDDLVPVPVGLAKMEGTRKHVESFLAAFFHKDEIENGDCVRGVTVSTSLKMQSPTAWFYPNEIAFYQLTVDGPGEKSVQRRITPKEGNVSRAEVLRKFEELQGVIRLAKEEGQRNAERMKVLNDTRRQLASQFAMLGDVNVSVEGNGRARIAFYGTVEDLLAIAAKLKAKE